MTEADKLRIQVLQLETRVADLTAEVLRLRSDDNRISRLEAEVAIMRIEIDPLKAAAGGGK